MNNKKIVYSAFFITLGIVLPSIFHFIGGPGLGKVFLPMHFPVLIGGAFLGSSAGLIIGILTPILSSLFTGMPPVIPMLPIMIGEVALYGLIMGYLYFKLKINIVISLLLSMIAGRIMAGLVVVILVYGFGLAQLPANPIIYISGTITAGIPGIIGQIILIPVVMKYIRNYTG